MPNKKSASKALAQSKKRQIRNTAKKNHIKKLKKKLETAIKENKKTEALALLKDFYKAVDKASKTNTIHKNTGARKKARMTKQVNKLK